MSQRITGNLCWTNFMIVCFCQMGARVLRWEGQRRTQTGTLPAAHSSCWGPQCAHEHTTGYELTVDMRQTVEWDRYCTWQPQNLNKESKNAEKSVHREYHTVLQGRHMWQFMETTRLHLKGNPFFTGSLQHIGHGPIYMNFSWKDSQMNGITKQQHYLLTYSKEQGPSWEAS